MAKQLNVNLAFTADTSKAKAQIRDLQAELTKLSTASTIGNFNNADMEKAIFAAKSLQTHLNNAVNVDTGKLDLSRFSKSLNSSNQSLESQQANRAIRHFYNQLAVFLRLKLLLLELVIHLEKWVIR